MKESTILFTVYFLKMNYYKKYKLNCDACDLIYTYTIQAKKKDEITKPVYYLEN